MRQEESAFAEEVLAWAIMGANVFVGLRFGVWETADAEKVAEVVSRLIRHDRTSSQVARARTAWPSPCPSPR